MNDSSVTRREFLNYIWAASIAVFMAGNGIVAFLFAWPRKPIQSVLIEAALLPASGSAPTIMPTNTLPNPYRQMGGIQLTTGPGHVFLAHLAEGLVTLDVRCTHQGCVMPFSESARRFDCPCHGAQFTLNGTYIAGPAPRDMDRYGWQALDTHGNVIAVSDGSAPLPVPPNTARIQIWTDEIINGKASDV